VSDEGFCDPGEPGDLQGAMRAGDLLNKPCLIRPVSLGEWPAKKAELDEEGNVLKRAQGPSPYYECDVWVLDRAGVVEHGTGVRISWVRVIPQLEDRMGLFVAATPRKLDDNSIVLQPFTDSGKDIARTAIKEIQQTAADEAPEAPFEPSDETF